MTHSSKLRHLGVLLLTSLILAPSVVAAEPSLFFSPSTINATGDDEIVASVTINTAGVGVSGAGAKIIYDPYYLSAIRIHPSDIFADYPATIIDNDQGKITISGIASSPTDLFSGEGNFADIVFRPYHAGTSKVKFIFTQGDTTDSNIAVMTGNGDILAQVNELTVNTTKDSPAYSPNPSSPPILAIADSEQSNLIRSLAGAMGLSKVVDKYASSRPGRSAVEGIETIDPLAPIARQTPITDPSTIQPPVSAIGVARSASSPYLIPMLLLFILILLGIVAWFVISRRPLPPSPLPPPPNPIN